MAWGKRNGKEKKYGNKKTELAGRTFDSRAESALFLRLSLEEREGRISNLAHQPGTVFLTAARIQYRPDFSFTENGETCWAEFKGYETPAWRKNLKLWRVAGPGKLYIWKGNASYLALVETVIPKSGICKVCGK